ncbi:DUF58 domain-containing protein [Myxococcota bacterium]|nr:DUF58 domain-containing protein [Myxococcota bacterium]
MKKLNAEIQMEAEGVVAPLSQLVGLRHAARGLALAPNREAQAPLAGPYRSAYRGRGIEFDEVRPYHPGDDIRNIDWRVTARTGSVHSKIFQEERERPVWLLVDAGPSTRFGTRRCFKSVAAAEAAALVAWSAHQQGDRIGGVVLAPGDLRSLTLRTGEKGLFELLDTISRATAQDEEPNDGSAPDLARGLGELRERARAGSRVVVLSDFYALDEKAERQLVEISRRTELTCVMVYDPLECVAPPPGRYRVSDGERVHAFSTRDTHWRDAYEAHFASRRDRLTALCRRHRMGMILLATESEPAAALAPILDPRHPSRRNGRMQ